MEVPDYDSLKNHLLLPFDHSSSLALTYHYEPVVFRPITTKIVMFWYSFTIRCRECFCVVKLLLQ